MTFRELVFYTLLLGAGLLIGHLAHAQQQYLETEHFWIQRNPHYLDRWTHNVHCCGPDHCKPASEIGVIVRLLPTGDWEVLGGPLGKPETIPAEEAYQTEVKEGGQQFWVCIWTWKAIGEQVACLFIPPPQT